MVKIYQNFDSFFVQFQVFDTVSFNFFKMFCEHQLIKRDKKVKTTVDVKVWTNGNYIFPFIF